MSDCARHMQPAESERERERAESSALAKPYYFLSHVPGWVLRAERAGRQQCARDLYKKASHPESQPAALRVVLLSARAMRVCFVLAGAHTPCMASTHIFISESGAYLHLKAAAATGLRALSLSEVIVSGAHCTTCGLWCLYVAIRLILFKAKIFVYALQIRL